MKNFKLTISYDGSRYRGWQRLTNDAATIQNKLETCLSRMCDSPIEIIGSGRTDGGVHAIAQVANFQTNSSITPEEIKAYCYQYLPDDIIVTNAEEVGERFHSRYNAKSKVYRYRICNNEQHDVFMRKYSWHVPAKLNLDIMKSSAALLKGEHDFKSFTSDKTPEKRSIRTLTRLDIVHNGVFIDLFFEADGFLYNMVRIIVGTLVEIGLKERDINSIKKAFEEKVRPSAGQKVPPQGLCLMEVKY
jgi:tRNA pseudouridine38-40 synthase